MPVSRSPHQYLERMGYIRTVRLPAPTLDLENLKVKDLLPNQLPAPVQRLDQLGDPIPDRGVSREWPPTE